MIESIKIDNLMGETQEMILTQPELSGFIVKSIDGLGPTGANINFTELVTIDGAIDNSARLETRELKVDLIFMTNSQLPLIEDVRLRSYKLFPTKKNVVFYIKTDRRELIHCYGRVEKNEPKIFQKQEGCTITIKCGDPFWHTEEEVSTMFYGVEPLFEFPYENRGLNTVSIPGEYSEYGCDTLIVQEKQLGHDFACDTVHIKLVIVIPPEEGSTVTTYSTLFDSYVSREINSEYYIQPSDVLNPVYENGEMGIYAKVPLNDTSIITVASMIFPLGISDNPNPSELVGKYILIVSQIRKGSSAIALRGESTEFGNINTFTEGDIDYEGDADTGFLLEIIAKGDAEKVMFFDMETNETMQLDDNVIKAKTDGRGIISGDVITINSKIGQKSVTLLREGKTYDILNALIPNLLPDGSKRIQWFKLNTGHNVFGYGVSEDGGKGLENLKFNVRYDTLYEGA